MFDSSSVAVIGIANFKIFSVEINTKYFDIQLSARGVLSGRYRRIGHLLVTIGQGDRERARVSNLLIGCRKKRSGK